MTNRKYNNDSVDIKNVSQIETREAFFKLFDIFLKNIKPEKPIVEPELLDDQKIHDEV